MPLLEPFKFVPRNIREWGLWFATLQVIPDDDSTDTDQLADNSVTLAKLADMATDSFMARDTAGIGDPEILSATESRLVLQVDSRVTVTSATYSAGDEYAILVDTDTAGGSVIISLDPAADRENHVYEIKQLGNGFIRINPDGAELIEFASFLIISAKGNAATIFSDGSAWFII